jgi:hypothetical protein
MHGCGVEIVMAHMPGKSPAITRDAEQHLFCYVASSQAASNSMLYPFAPLCHMQTT